MSRETDWLKGGVDRLKEGLAISDGDAKEGDVARDEERREFSVMWTSFILIVIVSAAFFLVGWVFGRGEWTTRDFFYNMGCNVAAMFIVVLCLDNLTNRNRNSRERRDEARKIMRYHRIISKEIDLYLPRKNQMITPAGGEYHKFRVVEQDSSVRDMMDMYQPSELVSDAGASRIRMYAHYQEELARRFENLLESIDFTYHPEFADAAMKYLDASSFGRTALEVLLSYEDSRTAGRPTKSALAAMIRDQPRDGTYRDADPQVQNVYFVYQMITEQEDAVMMYLKAVKELRGNAPARRDRSPEEYERSGGEVRDLVGDLHRVLGHVAPEAEYPDPALRGLGEGVGERGVGLAVGDEHPRPAHLDDEGDERPVALGDAALEAADVLQAAGGRRVREEADAVVLQGDALDLDERPAPSGTDEEVEPRVAVRAFGDDLRGLAEEPAPPDPLAERRVRCLGVHVDQFPVLVRGDQVVAVLALPGRGVREHDVRPGD